MKRYLPLIVIAVIAVAIGAGVALTSKDDNNQPSSASEQSAASQNETTSPSASQTPAAVTTDEVEIEDLAFRPQNITVKKGTTVTWTNKDDVAHTVTADSGSGPKSELLTKGESYSFTFSEVGEFSYHCTPHPQMTGKVTVTE